MKHKLSTSLGLIVMLTMALTASTAKGQTVAPGPYYANPSWDQTLACTTTANCPRFIVLSNMNSAAVLDRETGLVWEKSPIPSLSLPLCCSIAPITAAQYCNALTVGNRRGWRLPTIQELASLVDGDPANTSSPRLPPGHPFTGVQSGVQSSVYWSATTDASNTGFAWGVFFNNGFVGGGFGKSNSHLVWCVRGGQGVDPQ